jgi:hypothetical protein
MLRYGFREIPEVLTFGVLAAIIGNLNKIKIFLSFVLKFCLLKVVPIVVHNYKIAFGPEPYQQSSHKLQFTGRINIYF